MPARAQTATRTGDAVTLFQQFCLDAQPSLAAMEAKATAMQAVKQTDKTVPIGTGRALHQETWMVRRNNEIYQLAGMEGDAAAGLYRAAGCGLTAGEADGAALAQALVTQAGLGAPFRNVPASGQVGASVAWKKAFGANKGRVLLTYGGALSTGASIHLVLPKLPLD